MKLRIAVPLVTALVFLVVSSSASAALWGTTRSEWFDGATGNTLPVGTTKALNIFSGSNIILRGKLGSRATKIEWKRVRCFSCVIENIAVPAPTEIEAKATIPLEFLEPVLVEPEPAVCSATNLSTKMLTETIGMKSGSTNAPAKIVPKEGETIGLLEITGAKCPVSGSYKLSGSLFTESVNATGVSATVQEQTLSEAVQKELGGESTLKLGTEPASLSATLKNELSPTETFQVKE